MTELHGEVELVAIPNAVTDCVLHVRLADVSRADASATTIAETTITGVTLRSATDRVGFVLRVPELDPRRTYTIEAHLDVDGSGEVSIGDYRTMEHIGVTPATLGETVRVRLRPVR
jgi:uncharacterized lipoprotein YbaY